VRSSTLVALCALGAALAIATPAEAADHAAARRHYEEASSLFDAKRFADALPHFEAAYELSGRRPSTVFALAQCLRALGELDRAVERFEEYLASNPFNAEEVRDTLRALERERAARPRAPVTPPPPEAEPIVEPPVPPAPTPEAAPPGLPRGVPTPPTIEPSLAAPPTAHADATPEPGWWQSGWLWIAIGAAAVAGGVAVAAAAAGGDAEAYGGSTGVVLRP
jgi:tetratricopeptide (TPR) repeat protein